MQNSKQDSKWYLPIFSDYSQVIMIEYEIESFENWYSSNYCHTSVFNEVVIKMIFILIINNRIKLYVSTYRAKY